MELVGNSYFEGSIEVENITDNVWKGLAGSIRYQGPIPEIITVRTPTMSFGETGNCKSAELICDRISGIITAEIVGPIVINADLQPIALPPLFGRNFPPIQPGGLIKIETLASGFEIVKSQGLIIEFWDENLT